MRAIRSSTTARFAIEFPAAVWHLFFLRLSRGGWKIRSIMGDDCLKRALLLLSVVVVVHFHSHWLFLHSQLDKYVNKRTAREGYHVADESTIQKTVSRKSDHAKGRKEAGQKRKLPMDGRTGSNGRTKSGRTAHGGSRPVKTDAKGTESNKAGNNNHPTTAEAEQGMEQRDTLVGQQPSPEGAQKQAGSSKQANRDQNPQNNSRDAEEMTTNETEGKRRGKAKFTPPEELNKVVERTKRLAMDQKSSPAPAGTGVGKSKVPQPVENLLGEVGQVLSSNTQKGSVQWAVDQLSSALGDWIKRDTLLKRLSQARKKHLGPVGKVDDEQQQQQQLQEGNHGYDEAAQ